MAIRETISQWAVQEIGDVRRAPVAFALMFVIGLAGGSFAAWFLLDKTYNERIAFLQGQLDYQARTQAPIPQVTVQRITTWPSTALWIASGALVFIAIGFGLSRKTLKRENRTLIRRIDVLQVSKAAAEKGQAAIAAERDGVVAAMKQLKHHHAIEVLQRHSTRKRTDGVSERVTIRYGNYGKDYEIAQTIERLFNEHVKWPVTLDASNNPALPRAEGFKVVFDHGMTFHAYAELTHAFSEGNLLGVTVGQRSLTPREDTEHLIVLVLPSSDG